MAKILKNTTGSIITIDSMGWEVPANGQVTIPEEFYLLLGSEDSRTELDSLITSGDIVVNNGTVDLNSAQAKNHIKIESSLKSNFTIRVSKQGNNSIADGSSNFPFLTINSAISYINTNLNPSETNSITIRIDSGEFTEDPFTIPDYVKLIGNGDSVTELKASNSSADFVTLGIQTDITNLQIKDVTGTGFCAIKLNNTSGTNWRNLIREVQIRNCYNGIDASSSSTSSAISISGCRFSSLTNIGLDLNQNMNATMVNILANSSTFTLTRVNSTSKLSIFGGRIIDAAIGLEALNSGSITASGLDLSQISGTPVKCTSNTAIIRCVSCIYDESKIEVSNYDTYNCVISSTEFQEEKISISGELSVGLPGAGRESALGEGDSYVNGMIVYTFNGTTYTDVTTQAKSADGSTFQFPNLLVNSAVYISTDVQDSTDYLKFPGIKAKLTQAANIGMTGDIVFEYWNGSSWVEFNHMMTQSEAPYRSFGNNKFTEVGSFQLRFNSNISETWAKNDPISSGTSRYWIRLRIDEIALMQTPIFEQFKIHTNRIELEADGFQAMYGTGRIQEKFPITFTGLDPTPGQNPNDQTVYLSDNLGIDFKNNSYPSNASRTAGFTQLIPFEIDTSCPINLTLSYYGDSATAGTIQWRVRWATSSAGNRAYNSTSGAPSSFTNERTITTSETLAALQNNVLRTFSIELEIPEAQSQDTNGQVKSQLWLSIERVTTGIDDYNGSAVITDLAIFYTAWREGGYSGEFT